MITIQVTFVNGGLVGRRFADRWALDWMGRDFLGVTLLDISDIRTRADVDRLRRSLKAEGFSLVLYRDGLLKDMTARERAAFPRHVLMPSDTRRHVQKNDSGRGQIPRDRKAISVIRLTSVSA